MARGRATPPVIGALAGACLVAAILGALRPGAADAQGAALGPGGPTPLAPGGPTPLAPGGPTPLGPGGPTPLAPGGPTPLAPGGPPDLDAGIAVYQEHCASCHGALGRGDGALAVRLPRPPASLADPARSAALSPAGALRTIAEGNLAVGMPPFASSLGLEDQWDVLAAVLSLAHPPEEMLAAQEVWRARCASCHTTDGPPLGDLAWQAAHSADEMRAAMDGVPEHADVLGSLPADEMRAAVDYTRGLLWAGPALNGLGRQGALDGRIVHGGSGAGLAEVPVRLTSFVGHWPSRPVTVTTAADGSFAFPDVLVGRDTVHALTTRYDGVDYTSVVTETLPLTPPLQITVYDTSATAPLALRSASLLLQPDPGAGVLHAVEMWSLENASTTTRVADAAGSTVSFDVPLDAQSIRFNQARWQQGAALDGGTLTTDAPIVPGVTEAAVEFDVPYTGTRLDIDRRTLLPTTDLRVAVTGGDVSLEGDLTELRTDTVAGLTVTSGHAASLAVGDDVHFAVAGLPPSALQARAPLGGLDQRWLAALAVGLAVFGAVAVLTYPALGAEGARKRRRRALRRRRGELVDALADLERRRNDGTLDEATYRARRVEAMEEVLIVAREMRDTP